MLFNAFQAAAPKASMTLRFDPPTRITNFHTRMHMLARIYACMDARSRTCTRQQDRIQRPEASAAPHRKEDVHTADEQDIALSPGNQREDTTLRLSLKPGRS